MILNLTRIPSALEHDFFLHTLTEHDIILLTDDALMLSLSANPFAATGFILSEDSSQLGHTQEADWQSLSHSTWLRRLSEHDKQITW